MSLTRWVRSTSEHYLMVEAQADVARRYGAQGPLPPHGLERFWRRVYVPVFHRLPPTLRDGMIARMPGSHQERWEKEVLPPGPAV